MPTGLFLETDIEPVVALTLMRWVAEFSGLPSVSLTPVYVHVAAYDPQFREAENGVIARSLSYLLYVIKKVDFDWFTVFTLNGL